jgi:hypothetical protein
MISFENSSKVQRMDEEAFYQTRLCSIVFPASLSVVGKSSFESCQSLEMISFERNSRLQRIEEKTFASTGLLTIAIPACCQFLDFSAFEGVTPNSLSLPGFCISNSTVFTRSRTGILWYFGNAQSMTIPSSISLLGKSSFYGRGLLTSITFQAHPHLERIEERAFSMTGLKSICIPSSVCSLGDETFYSCKSLVSVTIEKPSRLERIEKRAFVGTGLNEIVIPLSVLEIGDFTFSECRSLVSVTFQTRAKLKTRQTCFHPDSNTVDQGSIFRFDSGRSDL